MGVRICKRDDIYLHTRKRTHCKNIFGGSYYVGATKSER